MNMDKFIDDLDLGEGETVRGYCPDCGGKNTFTATKTDGATAILSYKELKSVWLDGRNRGKTKLSFKNWTSKSFLKTI